MELFIHVWKQISQLLNKHNIETGLYFETKNGSFVNLTELWTHIYTERLTKNKIIKKSGFNLY